jgi:hypothetical protein
MAKNITKWSYWLGIACLVIAVLWRILGAVGLPLGESVSSGRTFGYLTFYRAGLLFFAATVASVAYEWAEGRSRST